MSLSTDTDTILAAARRLMVDSDAVIELRALDVPGQRTVSGYFDSNHLEDLAKAAARLSGKASGIYVTLNPVNPALLARASNKVVGYAKHTTSDADVLRRVWLTIDFDPRRPAGISATDEEKAFSKARALTAAEFLTSEGFPAPLFGDSGNGHHLDYRIALGVDDGGLCARVLQAMAFLFSDERVVIDTTTHNPARIWKLYGTKACKGDNIPERPHRLSRLGNAPGGVEVVPQELLEKIAARLPAPEPKQTPSPRADTGREAFSLESWIARYAPEAKGPMDWPAGNGRKWILPVCPWNPAHNRGEAFIVERASGAVVAGCPHNGCSGRGWHDLRRMREPGWEPYDPDRKPETAWPPAAADVDWDGTAEPDANVPSIEVGNRPMVDIVGDARNALVAANVPPVTFLRSGYLCRVRTPPGGRSSVELMDVDHVRGMLARAARFVRTSKKSTIHTAPPMVIASDILKMGDVALPELDHVIESPVLRPDGSILSVPGYDHGTRLFYAPDVDFNLPPVPQAPTGGDLRRSLALLDEAIGEFCFDSQASRANAYGLLLTPFVLPAVGGMSMMCLIDAPSPGTGKGLFAQVVYLLASGHEATMFNAPTSEEEWQKLIGSVLSEGRAVCIIDNVETILFSATLAMALTSPVYQTRLLGTNKMLSASGRVVWIATGNNIQLAGGSDLPRRSYRVRLDAQSARPWQDEEARFRHPGNDLIRWVREVRGELAWAVLVLCRHWISEGRAPGPVQHVDTFSEWISTVGGILASAGIEGFLSNLASIYDEADEETQQWEGFLRAWHDLHGKLPKTTAEIIEDLKSARASLDERGFASPGQIALYQALPGYLMAKMDSNKGFATTFGIALRKQRDVRHGSDGIHLILGDRMRTNARSFEIAFGPSTVPDELRGEAGLDLEIE